MSTDTGKAKQAGWLEESKKENHGLFSELDVLLKALDRFFIIENQPASKQSYNSKNLFNELSAVRDGITRVISILELVIPETNRNAYWFQKFAENKLMDARKRDRMRAGMYKQDTPEKSMYVLYDTFINLKSLVGDILRSGDITFQSFRNLGQIISKELRESTHFNPFAREINPDYDFIENKEISDVVKNVGKDDKKAVSLLFVHLFRIMRYLQAMDHRSMNTASINCSLLIFTLVRAEVENFRTLIDQSAKGMDGETALMVQSLAYSVTMESKRVFMQELKDIYERESAVQLRGKIESARGILKNLIEQTIIQLVRYFSPDVKGEDIFEVFITKTAQSMKLREDVYVLNRLISEAEKMSEKSTDMGVLSMLMNYMDYFENFTFKLLRYDDYEQFAALFNKVRNGYHGGEPVEELINHCHEFNIYLDTTLRQIDNRADLKDRPMDAEKAEEIVQQYLSTV